jgi:hypothetical protein
MLGKSCILITNTNMWIPAAAIVVSSSATGRRPHPPCQGLRPHAGANCRQAMRKGKQSTIVGVSPLRDGIVCIRVSFADAHRGIVGDSFRPYSFFQVWAHARFHFSSGTNGSCCFTNSCSSSWWSAFQSASMLACLVTHGLNQVT